MSDPILSLPGDIPGLLRRGSPVHWRDEETPYVTAWVGPWPDADVEDGTIVQAAPCGYGLISVEDTAKNFVLDLTDPTGRAHAAWWLTSRLDQHPGDLTWQAICRATSGIDMTPEQIDTLARLVLRLAGRSHA